MDKLSYVSLFLLPWLAQLDVLDLVYLFGIYDQFWVKWIQLLCLLEVFSCVLVSFEGLKSKCSSKIRMTIFWLQLNHLRVVLESLAVLVCKKMTLSSFMDISWLVICQIDGLT